MSTSFDFFKTNFPTSRIADYYLGCLDSSVFIDFDLSNDNRLILKRISFDRYGCCNLNENIIPMTKEDSQSFINTFKEDILNQEIMTKLIINIIEINKNYIWQEALKEYGFIK